MAVKNMSHITLHVRDMETSIAFYEKLGYVSRLNPQPIVPLEKIPLNSRVEFGGYKVKMGIMSLGLDPRTETALELLEVVETPVGEKPDKPFAELGIQRHCYRVSDLNATVAELREQGVEVFGEPKIFDAVGAPAYYQFLVDPDDNLVELIQFIKK